MARRRPRYLYVVALHGVPRWAKAYFGPVSTQDLRAHINVNCFSIIHNHHAAFRATAYQCPAATWHVVSDARKTTKLFLIDRSWLVRHGLSVTVFREGPYSRSFRSTLNSHILMLLYAGNFTVEQLMVWSEAGQIVYSLSAERLPPRRLTSQNTSARQATRRG